MFLVETLDLPTSRASKAELGERKIYTRCKRKPSAKHGVTYLTEKAAKDFGKVYKNGLHINVDLNELY